MLIYGHFHHAHQARYAYSLFVWIAIAAVLITTVIALLVAWIFSKERHDRAANQVKRNEPSETKRIAATLPTKKSEEHKKPSILWQMVKGIVILALVIICLFGGLPKTWNQLNQAYMREQAEENPYPQYNPDPLAISPHLYEEDAKGINDHSNQNIDHFDLVINGDVAHGKGEFGEEGHVRVPNNWNSWKKYWISDEPDRYVGFLYSGSTKPIGPFGANLPPPDDERFAYRGREFMVQGKGTLRFERQW